MHQTLDERIAALLRPGEKVHVGRRGRTHFACVTDPAEVVITETAESDVSQRDALTWLLRHLEVRCE